MDADAVVIIVFIVFLLSVVVLVVYGGAKGSASREENETCFSFPEAQPAFGGAKFPGC